MERAIRTEQGFTLIEVMVAMVVLTLALFELGRIQITSLRTTASANRLTQATAIAQDRAEQLLALAYNAPLLNVRPPGDPHKDPNPPTGYAISWDVDEVVNADPVRNIKTVNVVVTWRKFGTPRTLTVSLQKGRIV